ncbi:unnamed protein product [Rodentolepis nana]|uniref:WAP domain-containing protein n=1 Tax=Rodentolepis nana TaxID=102285 RepID=A0A0R3TT25_RODNA|nr:unnamed protein product [Rodentolepis nana]
MAKSTFCAIITVQLKRFAAIEELPEECLYDCGQGCSSTEKRRCCPIGEGKVKKVNSSTIRTLDESTASDATSFKDFDDSTPV